MSKGIKLFGRNKETKELERNPANMRKVRDFVARYSDPDELPFSSSQQTDNPVDIETQTQTIALVTENREEERAKKTKPRGNTLSPNKHHVSSALTQPNRSSDFAAVGSSWEELTLEEFPLIELPTVGDNEGEERETLLPTTEHDLPSMTNYPANCRSSSSTLVEESFRDADLPLIQPIEFDTQKESAVSLEDPSARDSGADDALSIPTQRATFTLTDAGAAPTEKLYGVRTSPLPERGLSLKGRDAEPTPTDEVLRSELAAVGGEDHQEQNKESSRRTALLPGLQTHTRRRTRKKHVHIGRRPAVMTENTEETDVLFFSTENEVHDSVAASAAINYDLLTEPAVFSDARAPLDHKERATVQKVGASGLSAAPKRVERPPAVRRELDGLDPCLVSFLAPNSFAAEQYRVLRHLVERLRGERGRSCVVAVSSPSAGDGKTTTSLNLAGALAQDADARVLLIDADLRRSAVLERLGGQPTATRGLVKAVLHPRLRLQSMTVQYAFLNLTILPAGQLTTSSYEILKSPRFGSLLEEAKRAYDYVILDTPPLVPIPDCRLIEQWADGFFVVVAAHKTPRGLVQEALAVIPEEKILGLVFNGDDPPILGYERYYGYSPLRAAANHPTGGDG